MEAMLNFIPAPVAIVLMLAGFIALAVGGIRLGYKATVKDLALELVEKPNGPSWAAGRVPKRRSRCSRLSAPSARRLSAGLSPTRCLMPSSNTPLML